MRNYIPKMKYVLLCVYAFSAFVGKSGTYSIKFVSDIYPITIKLYRYENNFEQEFIERIELKQEYTYSLDNREPDSYIAYLGDTKEFYFFIWDGDIQIDLNTKSVHKSLAKNSPLTTEYNKFNNLLQGEVYKEIRDLDTLLINMEKKGVKITDPLYRDAKSKRSDFFDQGPKKYEIFVRNYLKNNPTSFISLYYFDRTGLVPNEDEQLILKKMPPQLRENHRYIRLISP